MGSPVTSSLAKVCACAAWLGACGAPVVPADTTAFDAAIVAETSPGDAADNGAANGQDGAAADGDDASVAPTACVVAGRLSPDRPRYGRHYPDGEAAVDYAFGSDGFWKRMAPLEYTVNYYPQYATHAHPFDRNALIAFADGRHFTTARDANGHLLGDFDHDGELDPQPDGSLGFAFHEHAGRGIGGSLRGTPFTNFWFDDNWLARYMTDAYGRPAPDGLSTYADFTRWRILGGDRAHWTPYGSNFFDTLALDGLYAAAGGDTSGALARWDTIRAESGATYDGTSQRFDYPNIHENYHLGLFEILTATLLDARADLVDHWVAIRSNILSNQEHDVAGNPLGWRSDRTQAGSLMNIESLAAAVLGLGAGAAATFEPGRAPMRFDGDRSFFVRPHHVISAVVGLSSPGRMTDGPDVMAPPSSRPYDVTYFLRAPNPVGTVARLEIVDGVSGHTLASRDVAASDLRADNGWTRIGLSFAAPTSNCNRIAFRVSWTGTSNLDVGPIRVR